MLRNVFVLLIGALMVSQPLQASEKDASPQKKDYFASLTPKDEENIRFLITTLGSHAMVSLLYYKGQLEAAGDAIGDIHPLRVMAYIFSDPDLRLLSNRINRSVWGRFVKGWVKSFADSAKVNDFPPPYVENFAKVTGFPLKKANALIKKEQWAGLMNDLRQDVYEKDIMPRFLRK